MSKYLSYTEIVFKDRKMLLASLAACGFDASKIEEGVGLALVGYEGRARAETADIVIRRRYVGSASNDVGFRKTAAGYVPVISEFDASTFLGGRFVPNVRAAYSERVVQEVARRVQGRVTTRGNQMVVTF